MRPSGRKTGPISWPRFVVYNHNFLKLELAVSALAIVLVAISALIPISATSAVIVNPPVVLSVIDVLLVDDFQVAVSILPSELDCLTSVTLVRVALVNRVASSVCADAIPTAVVASAVVASPVRIYPAVGSGVRAIDFPPAAAVVHLIPTIDSAVAVGIVHAAVVASASVFSMALRRERRRNRGKRRD